MTGRDQLGKAGLDLWISCSQDGRCTTGPLRRLIYVEIHRLTGHLEGGGQRSCLAQRPPGLQPPDSVCGSPGLPLPPCRGLPRHAEAVAENRQAGHDPCVWHTPGWGVRLVRLWLFFFKETRKGGAGLGCLFLFFLFFFFFGVFGPTLISVSGWGVRLVRLWLFFFKETRKGGDRVGLSVFFCFFFFFLVCLV